MTVEVPKGPKNLKDGWVCPNCGNLNARGDNHCTDIQWREAEGWVETACGASKPEWIE